jgi:hypothetical protein
MLETVHPYMLELGLNVVRDAEGIDPEFIKTVETYFLSIVTPQEEE